MLCIKHTHASAKKSKPSNQCFFHYGSKFIFQAIILTIRLIYFEYLHKCCRDRISFSYD